MDASRLLECLPPLLRLALAYAPRRAQPHCLGLFALDSRLAQLVRTAREPVLAQIRLAWWRDRLNEEPGTWPSGEPLLEALARWGSHAKNLTGLVDGWEAMLTDDGIGAARFQDLATGRAGACAALAEAVGAGQAITSAAVCGRNWTLAEFMDGEAVNDSKMQPQINLPPNLRSLAIINALSVRVLTRKSNTLHGSRIDLIRAVRVGLIGR